MADIRWTKEKILENPARFERYMENILINNKRYDYISNLKLYEQYLVAKLKECVKNDSFDETKYLLKLSEVSIALNDPNFNAFSKRK